MKTIFCVLTMAAGLWGQSTVGRISGTVTDQSGAVVPGLTVTAQESSTGVRTPAVTQDNGSYVFTSLPPGSYTLTVEKSGFATIHQTGILLDAASSRIVNLELKPGTVTESISVEANAEQVQTDSGDVTSTIDSRQVTNISLNGRNYMQLLRLVPGTSSITLDAFSITSSSVAQSINGAHAANSASVTMDGVDNVDDSSGVSERSAPNPDSIAEVRVLTASYSAEFGKRAGAQVIIVTKSGTKDFHGSAFEFLRNNMFDARSFFAAKRESLHFNDFGWTLGGPIFIPRRFNADRNKLFFFWSEEWKFQHVGATTLLTLPTKEQRTGNFAGSNLPAPIDPTNGVPFPGQVVPASRFSHDGPRLLSPYPLPNFSAAGGNYSAQNLTSTDPREDLVKVDYILSDATRISARASDNTWKTYVTSNFGPGFPGGPASRPGYLAAVSLTHSFSPTLLSVSSLGYGYSIGFHPSPDVAAVNRTVLGLTGKQIYPNNHLNLSPIITVTGFNLMTSPDALINYSADFDFHEDVTKNWGAHILKMGTHITRNRTNEPRLGLPGQEWGVATFATSSTFSTKNALADVLVGNFASYTEGSTVGLFWARYSNFEFYGQDSWKVNKHLTLNLGLRWSILPPSWNNLGGENVFSPAFYSASLAPQINRTTGQIIPGTGDLYNGLSFLGSSFPDAAFGRLPGVSATGLEKYFRGVPQGVAPTSYTHFAPRLGFAYDPFGNGKTAIRGGFGMFYDRMAPNNIQLYSSYNPPFVYTASVSNGNIDDPAAGALTSCPGLCIPPSVQTQALGRKDPYMMTFNLNVQRELIGHVILDVGYVGTLGRHSIRVTNINQVPAGTLTNPANKGVNINALRPYLGYGAIYLFDFGNNTNYNSLQVTASRRVSRGLSFGSAFTWSKSMDGINGQGSASPSAVMNVYNVQADYGPSSFMRKFILSVNSVYELPFFEKKGNAVVRGVLGGWVVSGVYLAQSGAPMSVTIGSDVPGVGTDFVGAASSSPNFSRASVTGTSSPNLSAGDRTIARWFNTGAFLTTSQMTPGQWGNSGRGVLIGPGFTTLDMSLFKNFKVREAAILEFRAESFNLPNHASWTSVGTTVGTSTFGSVTGASVGRVLQFGMKLSF